uniref:Interphotoreceptor matrix proteoglycan 1 n=1 Tax=Seriola dumerili TaxID=41447 RepID=A0A3B4U9Z6_SERDU
MSTRTKGSGFELGRRRSRRSVFLHSGVRICPQETINEVLASHQAYYQLRVCQEAVWEAFRIFFDRIPGTAEYQRWVHTCQHESLCIVDLAKNFSSSEEHMSMVHRVRPQLKHVAESLMFPPLTIAMLSAPSPTERRSFQHQFSFCFSLFLWGNNVKQHINQSRGFLHSLKQERNWR